jgi:hypothetical protein
MPNGGGLWQKTGEKASGFFTAAFAFKLTDETPGSVENGPCL